MKKKIPTFLFGDFNIDVLKYGQSNPVSEYIDLLFSYGFLQTITKPTLVDHCLTNSTNLTHKSQILTQLLSDHFPILYSIDSQNNHKPSKYSEGRIFSDTNIKKFKEALHSINWNFIYTLNDTQQAYDYFSETFFALYDIYLPVIKKRFDINYNKIDPWFTNGLLTSRREKLKLDKKAAQTRNVSDINK